MSQQYDDYEASSQGGYPYGAGANNPPQQPTLLDKAKLYYDLAKQGYGATRGMLGGDDQRLLQGLSGIKTDWQKLHPPTAGAVNPVGLGGIKRPQTNWEQVEYPLHNVGGQGAP